jgi:hypothetical protein
MLDARTRIRRTSIPRDMKSISQHGSNSEQWEEREVSVRNDLPHYKWRDGSKDVGHIFFKD